MRPLTRITPVGPAAAYKTYKLVMPVTTHFRPATCAEVDCEHNAHGWQTVVDVGTELGARQARYVVGQSGRAYTWSQAGTLVTFAFPAGQTCFAPHHVPLERDPVCLVAGGDWRGNPRGIPTMRHANGRDWVDDFAENQDKLVNRLERG